MARDAARAEQFPRLTGATGLDEQSRRAALLAVLKIYDDRDVPDPDGCMEAVAALGLGDIADQMVSDARKRSE